MDRRLYEKDDPDAGLRMAARLGGDEPAIAKARIAMLDRDGNKARWKPCPPLPVTILATSSPRIQMLRRSDQLDEAVALMQTVPTARRQPRP